MTGRRQNVARRSRLTLAALASLALALAACSGGGKSSGPAKLERPPVELRARVDKAVADPGDIITFGLEAAYLPGVTLELPEIADELSDFRIVNSGLERREKGDRLLAERWYKLQADLSGSYVIEPIEVAYNLGDGAPETVKTPKIFIEIASMLDDDAKVGEAGDIRDIKPPMTVSRPFGLLLLIAAILIGFALAIVAGRKFIEYYKQRARAQELMRRPPHEEALEALDKLLKKDLIEKGRAREFCFEISEIFRRYMHARTDIPAVDLTTEEIIPRVEDEEIADEALRTVVRDFLTDTDLVKFAKYQPAREEVDKIIEGTRTFINETTVETTVGAGSAAGGETR
jgi:hypothetical protein